MITDANRLKVRGAFAVSDCSPQGVIVFAPQHAQAWETAAHYHLLHSVAVCITALVPAGGTAGKTFLAGMLLFSGSIYALVLLDKPMLGMSVWPSPLPVSSTHVTS